jgi:hypothetical protein
MTAFKNINQECFHFLGWLVQIPPLLPLCGKTGFSAKHQDFSHSTTFMNTNTALPIRNTINVSVVISCCFNLFTYLLLFVPHRDLQILYVCSSMRADVFLLNFSSKSSSNVYRMKFSLWTQIYIWKETYEKIQNQRGRQIECEKGQNKLWNVRFRMKEEAKYVWMTGKD